jgi:hypothetical protein
MRANQHAVAHVGTARIDPRRTAPTGSEGLFENVDSG